LIGRTVCDLIALLCRGFATSGHRAHFDTTETFGCLSYKKLTFPRHNLGLSLASDGTVIFALD
jgi:hypothetical protein